MLNTAAGKQEYGVTALKTLIGYCFSKLNSVGSSDFCHKLIKTKEINEIPTEPTDSARLAAEDLSQHCCSLVQSRLVRSSYLTGVKLNRAERY